MQPEREQRRVGRDVAMVALALVSIGLLAADEWGYIPEEHKETFLWIDLGIVLIFIIEYGMRLRQAREKGAFIVRNWYELPGMVPIFPGMDAYGPIRLFRLLRIFRILRLVGALRRFDRFERGISRFTRQSKLGYVALMAASLILICATLAWIFEGDAGEPFERFSDALWWAIVTATTVGYGDFYPRTGVVRAVAVVLMLLGVALIGTFAALLGNFLLQNRFNEGYSQGNVAADLEKVAKLHANGALNDEEYAIAKQRLLRAP